jgi:hypothetical protein
MMASTANFMNVFYYLHFALTCLGFLVGLGLGVFLIVRKRMLPGILALVAFFLFSLSPLLNIVVFRLLMQVLWSNDAYAGASMAVNCITGLANLLACAALIAAFVLLLRPEPKQSEDLALPDELLNNVDQPEAGPSS